MSHPPAPAGPPRHHHQQQHQQHQQQQHHHHAHQHHHSPQDAVPPPPQHYQPVSYSSPAPHHYAAHTAPPTHAPPPQYAYPSPGGQSVDQYRQSPTGPPPHQLALPSMRSFDQQGQQQPQSPHPQQQQQQQQQQHHAHHQQHPHHSPYPQVQHHPQQQPQPPPQHHHPNHYQPHMHHMPPGGPMGSTMAPAPHMSYFSIQPQPYALQDPMLRYNLSQGIYDPRMQLSGGRHKKEIKRRTKTGCLTCRKRRIKCDETHPTCNNCKKSKRECLGYDPIFKQQQQQASTTLQTTANSSPTSSTNTTAASTTAPAPYTTHPTPILTPSEPPSATREHCDDKLTSHIKYEEIELEKAVNIDPTLPSTYSLVGPHNNNHNTNGNAANSAPSTDYLTQKPGEALHLRGGGSPFSFTSSSAALPSPSPLLPSPSLPHNSPSPTSAHAYTNASVKMKVDDIVASFAAPLPETDLMPTPQSVDELTKVYYELYVPGLCHFFETDWFNFKTEGHNPVTIFLHNRPLISLLGSFLVSLHTVNADPAHTAYCANLEMRVVWALTKLAYVVPLGTNMPRDDPLPDDNASEIRNRVWVFETLLSGTELAANPLIPSPKNGDVQQRKEFDFWYCLAEFLVRQQAMTLIQQLEYRQQLLQKMRTLLDGRENRDLLYSMAIIRHWTPEVEPGWEDKVPDHLNEKEPVNQLHVAIQFVKAESAPAGGTTNVVRHLAFLAARALINPGCNLPRKA